MSLVRNLTKRMRLQQDDTAWMHRDSSPARTFSTRRQDKPFDRTKISLPVELLSSSNALAYEAPDLSTITANVDVSMSPLMETVELGKIEQQSPRSEDISSPVSSASSTKSYTESITSPAMSSASSITSHGDSRQASPTLEDHAHLKSFFFDDKDIRESAMASSRRETQRSTKTTSSSNTRQSAASTASAAPPAVENDKVPQIPMRAMSHTKRNHQMLARQRSVSRQSSERLADMAQALSSAETTSIITSTSDNASSTPKARISHVSVSNSHHHLSFTKSTQSHLSVATSHLSIASTAPILPPLAPLTPTVIPSSPTTPVTRSSVDMFGAKPAADHPFGAELAKVNELAEEYGVQDVEILDEESKWLIDNGFMRYAAEEYMDEIRPLFGKAFDGAAGGWL